MNEIKITGMIFGKRELRQTPSGKYVYSFSIGNKLRPNGDLNFFNVTAWNDLAIELNETMVDKGLYKIEGFLSQKKWKNKEGKEISRVEIVAMKCYPVERSKTKTHTQNINQDALDFSRPQTENLLEDIPF